MESVDVESGGNTGPDDTVEFEDSVDVEDDSIFVGFFVFFGSDAEVLDVEVLLEFGLDVVGT